MYKYSDDIVKSLHIQDINSKFEFCCLFDKKETVCPSLKLINFSTKKYEVWDNDWYLSNKIYPSICKYIDCKEKDSVFKEDIENIISIDDLPLLKELFEECFNEGLLAYEYDESVDDSNVLNQILNEDE